MKEHNPFIKHIEQLNNDSLLKLLTIYYEEGTASMSDPKSSILDDIYESLEIIDNNDVKKYIIRCIIELISGFNSIKVDDEKTLINENNELKQQLMEHHGRRHRKLNHQAFHSGEAGNKEGEDTAGDSFTKLTLTNELQQQNLDSIDYQRDNKNRQASNDTFNDDCSIKQSNLKEVSSFIVGPKRQPLAISQSLKSTTRDNSWIVTTKTGAVAVSNIESIATDNSDEFYTDNDDDGHQHVSGPDLEFQHSIEDDSLIKDDDINAARTINDDITPTKDTTMGDIVSTMKQGKHSYSKSKLGGKRSRETKPGAVAVNNNIVTATVGSRGDDTRESRTEQKIDEANEAPCSFAVASLESSSSPSPPLQNTTNPFNSCTGGTTEFSAGLLNNNITTVTDGNSGDDIRENRIQQKISEMDKQCFFGDVVSHTSSSRGDESRVEPKLNEANEASCLYDVASQESANSGESLISSSNTTESIGDDLVITTHSVEAYTVDENEPSSRRLSVVEIEQNVRQRMISETAQAEVVEPVDAFHDKMVRRGIWLLIAMVVMGIVVGLSVGLTRDPPSPAVIIESSESESPSTSPTESPRPVLETLFEEGVLRCGIGWEGIGYNISKDGETYEGFEVDLCRAVAAAVFNDTNPDRIELTVVPWAERWNALENRSIDLVTLASTHTMERDVYQETAESGFTFSIPYLYDGITFGGVPKFVACADKLDTYFGECRGTRVCVPEGSTYASVVKDLLPDIAVRSVIFDSLYQSLIDGTCNVITGITFDISTSMVRNAGYNGSYAIGNNIFSKEPLSSVTRDDDPQWSDFVNYVLQSLLSAEAHNITQDAPDRFTTTNMFGTQFQYMFINAIKAVGNYAELYSRNLESIAPRRGMNLLNVKGDSGLIYSHPFGSNFHYGPGPRDGGTLRRIIDRGYLHCGIVNRIGFGELSPTTMVWSGLDADYCRALSASIFSNSGETNTTLFVDLSGTNEEYLALSNGTIDVLSGASFNIVTDVKEPTTGQGFTFSQPYFYGPPNEDLLFALATRQDDAQWSDFVYFVVTSTFYAEEEGIKGTEISSIDMPRVGLFGLAFENMFRDAILAVGNYGEMYERSVGKLYPRTGTNNELNLSPYGPQHYPLPLSQSSNSFEPGI